MTLALIVWLVMTVFPALSKVAVFGTVVCFIVLAAVVCWGVLESEWNAARVVWKRMRWIFPLVLVLHLIPTKETAWYMVGAYATQTVVQSDTAKELASDSVDVLKSLIKKSKEYIDADQAAELDKQAAKPQQKQERT